MDIPPPPGPYAPPPQGQAGQAGPAGQTPYQQWPGLYSPYSRPPVNGFAIASLVLGILCFLPAVGLILGLVAFAQIKRKGERGKGLAIAGSILSVAGVLLLVIGIVTGGASAFMDGFREAARESRQGAGAFPVDKGGCFDAPDGKLDSMKYAFEVANVPCSGRHDGEVFDSFRVNHIRYPGDDAMAELAEARCTDRQDDYVMDSWLDPGGAEIYFFMPDRTTWRRGDRHVTCIFGAAEGARPLTGSLRRDASTLDAHQLAYVTADRAFDRAFSTAPEEELVENDLEGHKRWAARVDKGLAEQARQLRAHDWPARSRGHIDALVAEIGEGRKEWAKAAGASDADGFSEHHAAGLGRVGDKSAVAARKSLGLATTSPRDATPEDGPESGLDEDHGSGAAV
ncbi:DUF4190 domain-containing protein [Streptomyces sp. NPDC046465]|uniref:DUF4190 domain-containing protein n=1 Tax=Streptomyces sp. NPDC046465 TaxID=3155810 RepID=UPI0033DA4D1F